ncbi:MAG: hypothetical protein ACXAEN_20795 [Candidatus Thorarchaeota archaeon]|jgi:hypothetical protein
MSYFQPYLVVDNLTQAQSLGGLRKGEIVYVSHVGNATEVPLKVLVLDTAGGNTWSTARLNYVDYHAGIRVAKNEGTSDLTTTFTANNTPTHLRVRTSLPGGTLQAKNMTHGLVSDALTVKVDDPLQFDRTTGNQRLEYDLVVNITCYCTDSSSTFEFHFFTKTGATETLFVDSAQHQFNIGTSPISITIPATANMAFGDEMGMKVERISGAGDLVTPRFNMVASYQGQRGYYQ